MGNLVGGRKFMRRMRSRRRSGYRSSRGGMKSTIRCFRAWRQGRFRSRLSFWGLGEITRVAAAGWGRSTSAGSRADVTRWKADGNGERAAWCIDALEYCRGVDCGGWWIAVDGAQAAFVRVGVLLRRVARDGGAAGRKIGGAFSVVPMGGSGTVTK